jgi:hypothetical protein
VYDRKRCAVGEMSTFRAFCDDATGQWKFDFPKAVDAYIAATFKGCELDIDIREAGSSRTRAQERGYHAMIRPWHTAKGVDVADCKRYVLGVIWGYRDELNPWTGERLLVEPRTSGLGKKKYSELIERTMELAAQDGYVLMAPDEYRRAHPDKYPVKRPKQRVA